MKKSFESNRCEFIITILFYNWCHYSLQFHQLHHLSAFQNAEMILAMFRTMSMRLHEVRNPRFYIKITLGYGF